MACSYNTQLTRFNSKFWSPGAEAVDCFTQDWGGNCVNYVCPPPYLVCPILSHMKNCKAKGVIVLPEWKSAVFWPALCMYLRGTCYFADFVKDWFYLPKSECMFLPGVGCAKLFETNSSVFSGTPKFEVLALKVDFSYSTS